MDGEGPLSGMCLMVVPGGGIGRGRSKLLCQIASRLGAKVCDRAAELGKDGVVVCYEQISDDKLEQLVHEADAHTIVSDSWLSLCAEKKARVCQSAYLRARNLQPPPNVVDLTAGSDGTPPSQFKRCKAEAAGAQGAAGDDLLEPQLKRPKPAAGGGSERKQFVLVLAVREPEGRSEFFKVKERLRKACEPGVHANCAQRAGTMHFTLHTQSLTDGDAKKVAFEIQPLLPLQLKLAGLQKWPSCLAFKIDASSTELVNAALLGIKGLQPSGKQDRVSVAQDQMHLSLYRARGMSGYPLKAQIKRMKDAVKGMQYGQVLATEIALKEVGSGYGEGCDGYRVLARSSATL